MHLAVNVWGHEDLAAPAKDQVAHYKSRLTLNLETMRTSSKFNHFVFPTTMQNAQNRATLTEYPNDYRKMKYTGMMGNETNRAGTAEDLVHPVRIEVNHLR